MRKHSYMTEAERDECIELFKAGHTVDALAEKYNRGYRTIQCLIARRGAKRGKIFRTGPNKNVDEATI